MATLFGVNLIHIRDGIADALNYWGASMRSILPKSMQRRLTVGEEQIIVRVDKDVIRVVDNVHGSYTELGDFAHIESALDEGLINLVKKKLRRDKDLLLIVSDEVVLSKSIDFPAVAADNLRQALVYDMDKHTPFPKEDVLFDALVEQTHAAKVQAGLYILHRSQVESVLGAFGQAKIRFDRICSDSQRKINLLPEALRRKRAIFPYKRNIFLMTILLGLSAFTLALPLYFKRDAAIKLDKQIAQLDTQALGEGELWERRDAKEQVILDFIDSYPMPFSQIYEELSKLLPDSTWVTSLTYAKGKLSIRGEGSDVAGLISKINAHPLFKNARIASPIVKSRQDAAKEVYNITFEAVTTASGAGQ